MSCHRLLVSFETLCADRPELTKEAVAHLKVLRPKDAEPVELFDGVGHTRSFRYDSGARMLVAAGDVTAHPRPAVRELVLFACVTKGARWDWTLEKTTELGVSKIVPVISERTIVRIGDGERGAKRERWRRIVEEAARQSDSVWLPEMVEPVGFSRALEMVRETECYVGALTDPPPPMLLDAFGARNRPPSKGGSLPLAGFVGPEGDFTPEELSALLALATPASFGPTVLRAETAAIYLVSVLSACRCRP